MAALWFPSRSPEWYEDSHNWLLGEGETACMTKDSSEFNKDVVSSIDSVH